mmetsp:Transcript_24433/g.61413  ORF Transcript_24433/g.61413 Transcript_24433/m.61413 type:complete len:149 (+) Transcript_24433:221-667(+)|eukprot:CAMPEP_0178988508 /NCGR_PEP_ID=MMETSP0795-20121207/3847_1 /TAXON_ID=88552 /ORGANISM="Amoebophrya sp., Strain Ameob2" /LENGTH=148 /DNA_ID=CAMNT_0020679785 /DNA_START=167 /DNA_END=613 /DNA_ORIENTATION=+
MAYDAAGYELRESAAENLREGGRAGGGRGDSPHRNRHHANAAGQGGASAPHCSVCAALIDKEEDRATIEKSTRVILGLMSHYSETLLGVIKRGTPPHDAGLGKEGSDDEEEEKGWTACQIGLIVAIVVLAGAAIGGFTWAGVQAAKGR